MFSLEEFKAKCDVETHYVMIGGRRFSYFLPKNIEPFINPDFPLNDFPLWAKLWPSTMVLADFMAAQPADDGKKILEIGAGLGIAGIAASVFGHNVTVSEYNVHALEFAEANACINGCTEMPIVSLDWNHPGKLDQYDQIIGSEIIFREGDFHSIQKLFNSVLKPDGEVILVSEIRKPVIEFYRKMQNMYELKAWQKVLRSDDEKIQIIFCRMKP
jgi:predicted nicotinamide N-methyase